MRADRALAMRVTPVLALILLIIALVPAVGFAQVPVAPSGPSPASASTGVSTSTSLTWAESAGASTYDVAFGTTSSPPLVSANQTATSYTPPAALAHSKKYYWRITAKGPGGSKAGPLWSFTTVAAPPAVPGNPSPADGATAVATSTLLKWAASTRATSYDVAFGTSNPPTVVSAGQTTRSYTPQTALALATTYYWQITAKGATGSTVGPVWSFTTKPPPPTAPSGPSPSTAATAISISTSLTWAASAGASTYDVAFGTTSPPPLVVTGQAATSYTPPALAYAKKYYWRITARGPGGAKAGPLWSFTTIAEPVQAPVVPSGPSPASGATDLAISTALTWAPSTGASTYDVAFGPSNPPVVVSTNQGGTTYAPAAALAYATTYYWQITARGAGGSTAGPVWSFTTVAEPVPAPAGPSGPSPVDAATGIATSTALRWTVSTGASTYDVALSTSSPPTSIVAADLAAAAYTPSTALTHATTYYWQVTAKGAGGSTTGPVWSFTTTPEPVLAPAAPSDPSPANGATDLATSTALTWTPSTGASTYDVAFGTSNPPAVVSTNQAGTAYTPAAALAYATTYYWQITAKGAGGSTSGPVWSFTTQSAPSPDPPPTHTLDRLRVMTWNISMGKNLAGTMNVDAQVAIMADSGAHIIALQEVTISSTADLRTQYETKLEALTQREWSAVWAPGPRPTPSEGNLILTMLPVLSSSIFQYDSAPWDPSWQDTKRAAAQITVSVNTVPLNVFATHLPLDTNHRRSHINAMLAWIADFPGPRLFGGDFNMVSGTAEYTIMGGAFADTWTALAADDQGFTMDKRNSAGGVPGRIDYWWQELSDTQVRGSEIWVIKTTRSDHHALVIDLEVQAK